VRLVIIPAALAELQDAVAFYTAQANAGVGHAFVTEFERVVNLIFVSPQLGAVFRGTRRRYFLRRFPYSIIYEATQDELRVLALAHQRRRLTYWSRRK